MVAGNQSYLASFAPQARLCSLPSAEELMQTTQADVISVQVTQVNTGPSLLSITLNNHFESGDAPPAPQTKPGFPPWRYNDLNRLKPGQRIRVDFRYSTPLTPPSAWQTMIIARITGLSFAFPSAGGAQIALQGEDLLSLLKNFDEQTNNYQKKTEKEIVTDVVQTRSGSQLTPVVTQPDEVPQPLRSLLHPKKTPYLQFLQGIADRLDYEIWVADGSFDYPNGKGQGAATGSAVNPPCEPAPSPAEPVAPALRPPGGGRRQATC